MQALQQWYGADSYASSTGLYHWDDPNLASENGVGSAGAAVIAAAGYTDAVQDTLLWWNDANAITTLIDYMLVTGNRAWLPMVELTFDQGPQAYTMNIEQLVEIAAAATALGGGWEGGLVGGGIASATVAREHYTGFINPGGWYDDAGWWALAWLKAYDLTNDLKYLTMAVSIFVYMVGGWDDACGGGIYEQTTHTNSFDQPDLPLGTTSGPYKCAIANELFLAVAAGLYLRLKKTQSTTSISLPPPLALGDILNWANNEWQWFLAKGFINGKNLINDSLTTAISPSGSPSPTGACLNDGTQPVTSYIQGVILGALCDMFEITNDRGYLDWATRIANAFIQNPVSISSGNPFESGIDGNGILTEYTDMMTEAERPQWLKNTLSAESMKICFVQFKGIFVRNLGYLYMKTRNAKYRAFLQKNAHSAINNKNDLNQFGSRWDAPVDVADFVRQTNGVALLTATLAAQGVSPDLSYLDPLLLSN